MASADQPKQPIPIVLAGKSLVTANLVAQLLRPEYEVVHSIMHDDGGFSPLQALLSTTPGAEKTVKMSEDEAKVGSGDYSRPVAVVVIGGGFSQETWEAWRAGILGKEGIRQVPWLRADGSRSAVPPSPELAGILGPRLRAGLNKLVQEGRWNGDALLEF